MLGLSYSPIAVGFKLAQHVFIDAKNKMFKYLIMVCKTGITDDLFEIK